MAPEGPRPWQGHGRSGRRTEDGRRRRARTVRGGKLAPYTCRNVVNTLTAFFADTLAEEKGRPARQPDASTRRSAARVPDGRHPRRASTRIVHMTRLDRGEAARARPIGVPERRRVRYPARAHVRSGRGRALRASQSRTILDIGDADEAPHRQGHQGPRSRRSATRDGPRCGPTKTDNRVRDASRCTHLATARPPRLARFRDGRSKPGVGPSPTESGHHLPERRGRGAGGRSTAADAARRPSAAPALPDAYEGHNRIPPTRRVGAFATWLNEAGVAEGTIKRLMGHAGSGVTQLHYTAQSLETLRAAVECIRLDLSMGKLLALPVRMASGGSGGPSGGSTDEPQAGTVAAVSYRRLTAGRGTRRRNRRMIPSIAGLTQLVECQLPKLDVAGSNPVSRSDITTSLGFSRKTPAATSPVRNRLA
jgi:hypothetical protein